MKLPSLAGGLLVLFTSLAGTNDFVHKDRKKGRDFLIKSCYFTVHAKSLWVDKRNQGTFCLIITLLLRVS